MQSISNVKRIFQCAQRALGYFHWRTTDSKNPCDSIDDLKKIINAFFSLIENETTKLYARAQFENK